MYQVVVIDDEERILNNICNRIEKLSGRFKICEKFTDPTDALEYLKQHKVDVVFTDIRMPELDGLTLLAQINFSSAATVIISSYSDFSYAQSAIRLHVAEYLLKPFSNDELQEVLTKLEEQLDAQQVDMATEELTAFLKKGVFSSALSSLVSSWKFFSLVAFYPCLENLSQEEQLKLQSHFPQSIQKTVCLPLFTDDSCFTLCFCGENHSSMLAKRVAEFCLPKCGTAVYSSEVSTLHELLQMYRKLSKLFLAAVFLEESSCKKLEEICFPNREYSYLQEAYSHLTVQCRQGNREEMHKLVQQIVLFMKENHYSRYELQQQFSALLIQLHMAIKQQPPDFNSFAVDLNTIFENCNTYLELIEELYLWILPLVREGDGNKARKRELAKEIREYLEQNIRSVIGISNLTEYFGFSQTYLIRTFREEYGSSPIEYLIMCKMEYAKEQLQSCLKKTIREISEELGYSNQYYFSRAFKKIVGISPIEYKKSPKN